MQIKIVKKVDKDRKNKKDKNEYIFFYGDKVNKIKNPRNGLQYKKNDIVFMKKDNNGIFKIKKYQIYKNIITYLDKLDEKDKEKINKNLLINKFTNIFNLDEKYELTQEEKYVLKQIHNENEKIRKTLCNRFNWLSFKAKINDKLIIGLGGQSVFETDITLHHVYGVPYIPGQALKGMFRNYIIQEYFKNCKHSCDVECNKVCEKNAIKDKKFRLIFGGVNDEGKNVAGKVIFMDAFILNDYKIKKDVMTPHHSDYYRGIKQPLDSDEPSPIKFLVLNDDNTVFGFNIAIDKTISKYTNKDIYKEIEKNHLNNEWCKYDGKIIKEFILENLIDALKFHGIGAKTSVGYGYFNIDSK